MDPKNFLPCKQYDIKIPRNLIDHLMSMEGCKEKYLRYSKEQEGVKLIETFGCKDGITSVDPFFRETNFSLVLCIIYEFQIYL